MEVMKMVETSLAEVKDLRRRVGQRQAYLDLWEMKIERQRQEKMDALLKLAAELQAAESALSTREG